MRRDVCYYFETDSVSLYNAYLTAAKNPPFGRSCDEKPYHTFTFGLNYSIKYNMNGGACTLRFIPLQTGAAVNLRFSIAQLVGARYEQYASYLTEHVEKILHIRAQRCNINIDEFMKADSLVFAPAASNPQPLPIAGRNTVDAAIPGNAVVCSSCGKEVSANDAFCKYCGTKITNRPAFCTNCGAQASHDALFCMQCGHKLSD